MNEYIQPEELYRQLNSDQPPFLIDVRGEDAWNAGHIPGAHHIPSDTIAARMAEIPRDQMIVTY
jgi:rhodanese-related sulfurtransferase